MQQCSLQCGVRGGCFTSGVDKLAKCPLRFDILRYPRSRSQKVNWERCVRDLVPLEKQEETFEVLELLNSQLVRGTAVTFTGQIHCEAMMCALYFISQERTPYQVCPNQLLLGGH